MIFLLNAIFANKKIPRVAEPIAIQNPFLEKESGDDKLSVLDIKARLGDGSFYLGKTK